MNAVGSYDDLDMTGIQDRWYANIPRETQDALRTLPYDFRFIWNDKLGCATVIERSDPSNPNAAQATRWHDGWLEGWSIVMNLEFPLGDGEAAAGKLRAMIDYFDKLEGVTDEQKADSVERALNDAADAQTAKADAEWSDKFDDSYPKNDREAEKFNADCARAEDVERGRGGRAHDRSKLIVSPSGATRAEPKLILPAWLQEDR